jgi:hypothetical protein
LGQSLQAYRFYQARIQECDAEIERHLQQLAQLGWRTLAADRASRKKRRRANSS